MIRQDSRWAILADLYDPREPGLIWPAGAIVSVKGVSLLKGGEVLLEDEKTGDNRWVTMEGFERALTLGAVEEFG